MSCDTFSVCELQKAGTGCHEDVVTDQTGWCYVDPFQNPDDNPALVASCPAETRRIVRFVDPMNATPAPGATVLLVCPN